MKKPITDIQRAVVELSADIIVNAREKVISKGAKG